VASPGEEKIITTKPEDVLQNKEDKALKAALAEDEADKVDIAKPAEETEDKK